jgi:hypothetical protein
MTIDSVIEAIEVIDKSQDLLAMDAAAELLVVKSIPEDGKIAVKDLIGKVVDIFPSVRKVVPSFDFGIWTRGTVLESIDMLIAYGVIDGPIVDMTEKSHELLEAEIGRTDSFEDYETDLEYEIECYAPAPKGRQEV